MVVVIEIPGLTLHLAHPARLFDLSKFTHMDRRRPRNIPSRPLVLVVDDHDDTREMYAQGLGTFGFDVIGAADCQQGCRRAWGFHPDIVVSDLTPGPGDGWQLIRNLRREARTRDIPVVLLTADASESFRERAARQGCAGFFLKPCLPDDLATELRHVIERGIVQRVLVPLTAIPGRDGT
jgi:two-component system cell cycle response regulator DivK